MLRLSAWLLRMAYMFRRWTVDRELAAHVLACKGHSARLVRPGVYGGACTKDLENCDENQFCRTIGKPLFNESFDLTFKIGAI